MNAGVIEDTIPSRDGRIRKVNVKIVRQGTPEVFSRPVSDVVFLRYSHMQNLSFMLTYMCLDTL